MTSNPFCSANDLEKYFISGRVILVNEYPVHEFNGCVSNRLSEWIGVELNVPAVQTESQLEWQWSERYFNSQSPDIKGICDRSRVLTVKHLP